MEPCSILPREETLAGLPPPSKNTGSSDEVAKLQSQGKLPILVVLDDDPTGTQTCHGINVLTVWDKQTLVDELKSTNSGFFILTNSRALPTLEARNLVKEICLAVKDAASTVGKEFEFVMRGDSTLRGHFPDEPEVAEEVVGKANGWILAPFFRQGGRLTIDNVHYVAEEDKLVPAAQTPFAKDATFGYKNSDLAKYVAEKSTGRITEGDVGSISLNDIRTGGPSAVKKQLLDLQKKVIIVNSVVDEDMEVFVLGLLQAQQEGRRYIYRTGAAFVSTRLGIEQIPPLGPKDLQMDTTASAPGGLIVAGSYVPKTTAQLESLVQGRGDCLRTITIDVEQLLADPDNTRQTVRSAAAEADKMIVQGEDVLIMTSRKLITAEDEVSSLKIGSTVAQSLVDFMELLEQRPRYVIAKGGITSSDAASKSLRMRRAEIAGQAASGVPLWRCHESSSKWAGIPYVVFPGNVGSNETLRDLVAGWAKQS
ncbi:uncharacterized protein HMPREF1541_00571 [Cyphellophora europaea CBS 101466]|uniref:Four-carbon acid sugar kinase nucleotide binding domain-containing protein n=1 Tax=Cyphellophora europaea (strain CBS 101466) TaxID=1220924 RepID=W2SCI1_CYPE1|nr:uncharacterized protein HMPREF1541_00571 [Cyphellophora europaea CBS 101466]ETN46387.1 hypothetical protein HMPREF1541_00571 [Cyphellophora europaea CBS 101466]